MNVFYKVDRAHYLQLGRDIVRVSRIEGREWLHIDEVDEGSEEQVERMKKKLDEFSSGAACSAET